MRSGRTAGPTEGGRIVAVLGPTNTGKTHLAVERMLAHESGMMGFPLRLLAREIYDRIVAIKGEGAVALRTGEEKIGSDMARYVIATVEAMPMSRQVAFLAVDEIQLCADYERGHVFTDRLMHARGYAETMFLGSDTIRRVLKTLVPSAELVTRPRFSILSHAGQFKLNRLPRRSAVVAFTAGDVYSLAEVLRRQKGGAAVVLGALSPRTRNAQVALYQSGEVDHLVATDAIGMGLNMDLAHVTFAQLHKFDGREQRRLHAHEIAQIAGRAGRHMADGTFGTLTRAGAMDERMVEAVETHSFAPIKALRWRASDLDFRSIERLLASLDRPPPAKGMIKVRDALDDRSLAILARSPEVRERAIGTERVRLLWQVCQIPDFRKTLTDAHIQMLAHVYDYLTGPDGVLPSDWVGRMIARLDRTDGDIDTLVNRIAHIRTWTYLSHRDDWLRDPLHWQACAREVEDRLSDALHERLTQKFVDRRTAALMRSLRERGDLTGTVGDDGEISVDGHRVGRIDGFRFSLAEVGEDAERRVLMAAARKAMVRELGRRARALVEAEDGAFSLSGHDLQWSGEVVAQLRPSGKSLDLDFDFWGSDALSGQEIEAVRGRLRRWLDNWLEERIGPLQALERASRGDELSGSARGLAFRLVEVLGVMPVEEASEQVSSLNAVDRKILARLGLRFGVLNVYLPALIRPSSVEALARLQGLARGEVLMPPPAGRVNLRGGEIPQSPLSFGYMQVGDIALRVDMAERLAARLRAAARHAERFVIDAEMMSISGLSCPELAQVLPALGFRVVMVDDQPMVARRRRRSQPRSQRPERKHKAMRGPSDSPFAALAQLKAMQT
ncbi:MAG: disulfide oxidoreductase [Geminicoccaceae bacterium]|nr:disulfide oxidoreductase [Geminicoccaceae bacterium]MCB9943652.1 disulfide oxidoreductase [Geminicoccaceae bacterium]